MGVIKEGEPGNRGRGKERRNGPWSDENISSREKSNAAFGGVGSGEDRKGGTGSSGKICPHAQVRDNLTR